MTTSRPLSTARTVSFKSAAEMIAVLGPQDAHLAIIEDYFEQISLRPKDLDVLITGPSEAVNTAAKLLNELRVPATTRRLPCRSITASWACLATS